MRYSGSGKTTLLEKVIPLLTGHGLRIAVIKHAHHDFDIDKPGKDTFRHRQAGAGEDQHLQPRELKGGFKTDDYYEVIEGVKEGDQVVTRALFLVDSASQLKAAIAGMGEAGGHKH